MSPVLAALLLLQVKHFLADFVLQSRRQVVEKGSYGAWPGVAHAGIHAGLTLPCLLLVGVAPIPAVAAAGVEFVVHYHLDWTKERARRRTALTPTDHGYWMLIGGDQLAHQLTYLVLLWIVL